MFWLDLMRGLRGGDEPAVRKIIAVSMASYGENC